MIRSYYKLGSADLPTKHILYEGQAAEPARRLALTGQAAEKAFAYLGVRASLVGMQRRAPQMVVG